MMLYHPMMQPFMLMQVKMKLKADSDYLKLRHLIVGVAKKLGDGRLGRL